METRLGERLAAGAEETKRVAVASAVSMPAGTPAKAANDSRPVAAVDGRRGEAVAEQSERSRGAETPPQPSEAVENGGDGSPQRDAEAGEDPPIWPDESAEAAFLAEARERGEPVKATPAAVEMVEEAVDPKALPKLDDLVHRIPAEVRDTLEELFRAKFVRVQRVPRKALKG